MSAIAERMKDRMIAIRREKIRSLRRLIKYEGVEEPMKSIAGNQIGQLRREIATLRDCGTVACLLHEATKG